MYIVLLYLAFENGVETKQYDSRFFWQNHFLTACDINNFSFFPFITNQTSNKNNISLEMKLRNRLTIFGFLDYNCPICADKRNILMVIYYMFYLVVSYIIYYLLYDTIIFLKDGISLKDLVLNIAPDNIIHFWDKCPPSHQKKSIKLKLSKFLTLNSDLYDKEIFLENIILDPNETPFVIFRELNYKNKKRHLKNLDQLIFKDKDIDRFIEIDDFIVEKRYIDNVNEFDQNNEDFICEKYFGIFQIR